MTAYFGRSIRFVAALTLLMLWAQDAGAQGGGGGNNNGGGIGIVSTGAVGGVSIDVNGVLNNAEVDQLTGLHDAREKAMQGVSDDMKPFSKLRKVSLRGLQAAIAAQRTKSPDAPLSDDLQLLAGLQRIQYVFVYPDQQDIVIAGPAEGWKIDDAGYIVGETTGKAVMRLEDFAVAMRTGRSAANGGLSCSIDPTADGMRNLQQFVAGISAGADINASVAGIEESLGPQVVSVNGIDPTTPFAHILVAADYRMKRLAMGFEASPVQGLPNYLQMIKAGSRGVQNMTPRWWLAPNYDPLLKDNDGLAWELRGAGVKAMTEDDFFAADGSRTHTGKASAMAQKWSDNMTKAYDKLSVADPIFAELRNVMDMAVAAALISKEQLAEKSNCSLDVLLDTNAVRVPQLNAPKQVPTQANFVKKGGNFVISASGGVQINSWLIANENKVSEEMAPARDDAAKARQNNWWWD
ncbi:MAG: DUF1598 domain-containing protein [Planctomycetia bacterium]|nr:DUF1598 domain-containing protein [Planctomycetia bacterium]